MRRFNAFGFRILAIALAIPALFISGGPTTNAQATITCAPDLTTALPPVLEQSSPTAVAANPFPEDAGVVTVFAAASLTDAFSAVEADLEAATPGLDLVFNFAGSQALVTQLLEGAEADVFASANDAQMDAAVEGGIIDGIPVPFASNRLAIVVPADNPAGIAGPADLANDGVHLVIADESVPVGTYARESICLMGEDAAAYGQDFVNRVASNIVSNESNVRNVLAKIELGEADAGIVYVSDITTSSADAVLAIDIPSEVNRIASYPIAPVTGGNVTHAQAFISYLLSEDGRATMQEHGFQAP